MGEASDNTKEFVNGILIGTHERYIPGFFSKPTLFLNRKFLSIDHPLNTRHEELGACVQKYYICSVLMAVLEDT